MSCSSAGLQCEAPVWCYLVGLQCGAPRCASRRLLCGLYCIVWKNNLPNKIMRKADKSKRKAEKSPEKSPEKSSADLFFHTMLYQCVEGCKNQGGGPARRTRGSPAFGARVSLPRSRSFACRNPSPGSCRRPPLRLAAWPRPASDLRRARPSDAGGARR